MDFFKLCYDGTSKELAQDLKLAVILTSLLPCTIFNLIVITPIQRKYLLGVCTSTCNTASLDCAQPTAAEVSEIEAWIMRQFPQSGHLCYPPTVSAFFKSHHGKYVFVELLQQASLDLRKWKAKTKKLLLCMQNVL